MSNKAYDIWKAIAQIILPALITLYGVIGSTLEIPYTEAATAVDTCIGSILAKLSSDYHKNLEKEEE